MSTQSSVVLSNIAANVPAKATQAEKGLLFKALHEAKAGFVMPNPWDVGSTVLLEKMGFKALGSTSAGLAFSLGQPDGTVSFEKVLDHLSSLTGSTDLPISADMETFFAGSPEDVHMNVIRASASGIVGASIQDSSDDPKCPLLPESLAQERVYAAVEAGRSLDFPFTLTARAECFTLSNPSLDETIKRLKLFEEAGADVLFAPWLKTATEVKEVLAAVNRPLSVMLGFTGSNLTAEVLFSLGVKRISTGASLARAAYSALLTSAAEVQNQGTFTYANNSLTGKAFNSLFGEN